MLEFWRGESKGGRWFNIKSCLVLTYIVGKRGQGGNKGNIVWIFKKNPKSQNKSRGCSEVRREGNQ